MSGTKAVLVTGASGFIGANIVKYLAQQKRRVVAITRNPSGPDPLLKDYLRGLDNYIDWVIVDLTDHDRVINIAKNFDLSGVIHAAIFTAVATEIERRKAWEILNSNLLGTVNTLELARIADVESFVYVSSSGLYGSTENMNESLTEDSSQPYLKMSGFYSITKITGEKLTERYNQLFGFKTTAMRIAAPYGCMERPTGSRNLMGPIYNLLKLIVNDEKKEIHVKGLTSARDWTYAMDTAQGLVAALDAKPPLSPVYNNSYGQNYSIHEILTAIKESSYLDFSWKEVTDVNEADITATWSRRGPLSVDKSQKELGFTPKYDLKKGIKEYYDWWDSVTKKGLYQHLVP